jgi:hypothetical protein
MAVPTRPLLRYYDSREMFLVLEREDTAMIDVLARVKAALASTATRWLNMTEVLPVDPSGTSWPFFLAFPHLLLFWLPNPLILPSFTGSTSSSERLSLLRSG